MFRRNILIFHNAALGDFVVTWPLALACGRLFPQSRVIYVTAGQKGKLAEHVLGVESVDIESGFAPLWSSASDVSAGVVKMLQGAAMIFSFIATDNDTWTANVKSIAPEAALALLSTNPPAEFAGHVSRFLVRQVQPSQSALASAMSQLIDSLARRGLAQRVVSREGVLIHPGSGAERKNWPRERFMELAQRLADAQLPVRVVLGEVEIEKWGTAARDAFAAVAPIVQPRSLVELAQVISSAHVVVCNDSGPAHLAAVMGMPTTAIFGPTSNAVQWKPAGPAVTVVEGDSLESISVEQVLRQVRSALAASAESAAARSVKAPSSDD